LEGGVVADCTVAQQEIGSHTHAAPQRWEAEDGRRKTGRHAISEAKGRAIVGGISSGDDVVTRSRDHLTRPSQVVWCSMCLECAYCCAHHCQLTTVCLVISPLTFLLGALVLRQTARSRIVCVAVLSLPALPSPSLPTVAHRNAQTCFSRWHAR
jgi:hypothetical protein